MPRNVNQWREGCRGLPAGKGLWVWDFHRPSDAAVKQELTLLLPLSVNPVTFSSATTYGRLLLLPDGFPAEFSH